MKPFPSMYLDEIMPVGVDVTTKHFAVTRETRHEGVLRVFRVERENDSDRVAGVWMDNTGTALNTRPHYGRVTIDKTLIIARFNELKIAEALVDELKAHWTYNGGDVLKAKRALAEAEAARLKTFEARAIEVCREQEGLYADD